MGKKMNNKGLFSRLGRIIKGGSLALGAVVVAGALAIGVHGLTYDSETQTSNLDRHGWGAEVADAVHDTGVLQSIIKPANACGLGASSCFRCHNGRRAPEPTMDPIKAPWHADHSRVNNSCVGCHNGNPRLMREQMAHQNMLSRPRATPDESCTSCHRDAAELQKHLDVYLKIGE